MRRLLRTAMLAGVLSVTMLIVPNGGVNPTESVLVKVNRALGVDLSPDVIWIMAVGSDARPGQNPVRSRGDALQLVGINTRTGAATSIGFPRDSWMSIPGYGSNRINAALYFGGPKLMGKVVQNLTGIEPDYVMVASFWGLRHMVDAIGGIVVNAPYAFSDVHLRPKGFHKGRNRVDGNGAIAFSRIRKSLPRGDFERSEHQQGTIRAIRQKIRDNAAKPGFIERGVLSVLKNMHTNLSPSEFFRIAQAIAQVDPHKITGCVVQGSIGNVGGASVVFPNTSAARAYGNDARKDAVLSHC